MVLRRARGYCNNRSGDKDGGEIMRIWAEVLVAILVFVWLGGSSFILVAMWDGMFCGDNAWQRKDAGSWFCYVSWFLALTAAPAVYYCVLLFRDWGW